MNVKILYSTPCAITIYFCEGHELASAEWGNRFTNLQDAIDMGKYILRYVLVSWFGIPILARFSPRLSGTSNLLVSL